MKMTPLNWKWAQGALLLFVWLTGGNALAGPGNVMELKGRADCLLKEGKSEQAISLYEKVLERDRHFANAYYNLATAYYLQGEMKKAAENLESFLRLHPNDGEALYNLGCLKLRLGSLDEAMRCFLRAENCPCAESITRKIKEALHFMEDLQRQTFETQELFAYLASGLNVSPSKG